MIDHDKDFLLLAVVWVVMWITVSISSGCSRTLEVHPTAPAPTPTICRGCE